MMILIQKYICYALYVNVAEKKFTLYLWSDMR